LSPPAGAGHNHPPDPEDPVAALDLRLARKHRELVVRFIDLELGCTRVPNPLESEEDAAAVTDFIAQCQVHLKRSEAAHKQEKEFFLKGGRIVDAFFKRRRQKLTAALAPVVERLKSYRDRIAAERRRRAEEVDPTNASAQRARQQAALYRADAERLIEEGASEDDRKRAAELWILAEEADENVDAIRRHMAASAEPVQIRGDYGSTAYVRKSWTFAVVDLDAVPREYMSLDVEVVREAINKDGVREIPGLRIYQNETLHVRGAA
jgi:hypothetical protein